jgi:hypothetical protein
MNIKSRKNWLKAGKCALFAGVFVLIVVLFACTGLPGAGIGAFGGLGNPSDPVPYGAGPDRNPGKRASLFYPGKFVT